MARRWWKAGVQVSKLITTGRCTPPITALIDVAIAEGSMSTLQAKSRGENFHLFVCFFIETGFHYVALTDLELTV